MHRTSLYNYDSIRLSLIPIAAAYLNFLSVETKGLRLTSLELTVFAVLHAKREHPLLGRMSRSFSAHGLHVRRQGTWRDSLLHAVPTVHDGSQD